MMDWWKADRGGGRAFNLQTTLGMGTNIATTYGYFFSYTLSKYEKTIYLTKNGVEIDRKVLF